MKDDIQVIPGFDEAAEQLAVDRAHIDLLNAVVRMLQFAEDSNMQNGAIDRLRAAYNAWKNSRGV